MSTILDRIIAHKREEVSAAKRSISIEDLKKQVHDLPPPRDFFAALRDNPAISLIAEVKRASPSAGLIREDFDPVQLACDYEAGGADCLSVLTDEHFFQGKLEYLKQIRAVVQLPLLRKDFIIDEFQLYEARVAGADAVLLIAECLDDCLLRGLHNQCLELCMQPLVELYLPSNVPRVIEAGATLIGINNRDLRTFETDLSHTIETRPQLPENCLVVSESGIHGHHHMQQLAAAGIDAVLVGEYLMRQPDVRVATKALLGG